MLQVKLQSSLFQVIFPCRERLWKPQTPSHDPDSPPAQPAGDLHKRSGLILFLREGMDPRQSIRHSLRFGSGKPPVKARPLQDDFGHISWRESETTSLSYFLCGWFRSCENYLPLAKSCETVSGITS